MSEWYQERYAGDPAAENPFGNLALSERPANTALRAYLRSGGKLSDWIRAHNEIASIGYDGSGLK